MIDALPELLSKANNIKALLFDVDGVLTDGGIIYDDRGNEFKKFHAHDGMMISHLKEKGFKVGAITARRSKASKKRCLELDLDYFSGGARNKIKSYEKFKSQFSLADNEIAYVGDDLFDLPVLTVVGLSICPRSAPKYIQDRVDWVTDKEGGHGVVREAADFILHSQGLLDGIISQYANVKK